ncbi:hypothetical protein G6F22_018401 [Rhizopus arrhizus]|nr:hypothetical protein G6F22_018401 [Rhizopus arrhizus]
MAHHVGQLELQRLELGQPAIELPALVHIAAGGVQRALRRAHRARADVDAATVQALHGDLEALALLAQQIAGRHADVFERDGARGLAVPAHLLFLAAVADARRIGGHRERADAACSLATGARHHDQQVGIAAA